MIGIVFAGAGLVIAALHRSGDGQHRPVRRAARGDRSTDPASGEPRWSEPAPTGRDRADIVPLKLGAREPAWRLCGRKRGSFDVTRGARNRVGRRRACDAAAERRPSTSTITRLTWRAGGRLIVTPRGSRSSWTRAGTGRGAGRSAHPA